MEDINTGGRVRFDADADVRVLLLDGTISQEVYRVAQERSDRKGHVLLRERDGTRTIRVHYRRVLPLSVEGKAVVIESGDRFWAICPKCGQQVSEVGASDESYTCQRCAASFLLHWLGVRPMETIQQEIKNKQVVAEAGQASAGPAKAGPAKAGAVKAAPAKAGPVKAAPAKAGAVKAGPAKAGHTGGREDQGSGPANADTIAALSKLKNCELWTKNVRFNHERIDVKAHCLLYVGDRPRKLCFNTYNMTLGRRTAGLPIDAFIRDEVTEGDGKVPWFYVKDLDEARRKLRADGYERQ